MHARKALQNLASLVDEIMLTVALALIVIALWPWIDRGALVIPGVVLLWLVLPARAPFLSRPPTDAQKTRTRP